MTFEAATNTRSAAQALGGSVTKNRSEAPAAGADALPADGCAASGDGGALGDVDAFFGVTETQARAGLQISWFGTGWE